MLKKLAYFTGWLVVLCLSLLFCFTLGLWQNWRTSSILLLWLLMLLLAVLLWALFLACLQLFRGRKERRWLAKYRLSRREYVLLKHWKTGASVIKRIQRKRHRLPWFLLIGEQSGKSTLLGSSGLPLFYGEMDDAVPGPTRTLRWWFFRRMGILDLSSNFLVGGAAFRQGWERIAHWCTKMPMPAGIIITLSVSELLNDESNTLHAMARKVRALIEPLIQHFGEQLPLHIIVTQCDRFPGFSLWQRQLSDAQRQQTLGYSWNIPPHIDGEDPHTLQPLFSALKEGLSSVRLSMGRPFHLSAQDYSLLLDFPENIARLEPPLRLFLASLCEPNAYFSHTSLSGVWFTATEPQANNRARRTSVFAHHLLTEGLCMLSQHRIRPRWYHRPKGKVFIAVLLAVCVGWLGISAMQTANRLQHDITHMSPTALAAFLEQDEQLPTASLMTFPFSPILRQQQTLAGARLARIVATPRPLPQTFQAYQQRVLAASLEQQREYILQLANALLVWQEMRDHAILSVLQQRPAIAGELQQYRYPATVSPLTRLALERYHMQSPEGEQWLQTARALLINLVNRDPSLEWLLSPSPQMPALHASTYWPSLSQDNTLSGGWTRKGEAMLAVWMAQIERAAGGVQPVFERAREQRFARKQDAWSQFLSNVSATLSKASLPVLTHNQLIALSQGQSQAMQFANRAIKELDDVPSSQAQPWLTTLRSLQRLALTSGRTPLMNKAQQIDSRFRHSLAAWLRAQPVAASVDNEQPVQQAWLQWQNARNEAVNDAMAQGPRSDRLTRGMFTIPAEGGEQNPLLKLTPALIRLKEHLSGTVTDTGSAAVWSLYEEDTHRLLAYAMMQSACWLNEQWKSQVIWPLGKDEEQRSYEEQQALSQKSVAEFLRGPAKAMLSATRHGLDAATYAGMSVPLTTDFLLLARQVMTPDMLQDVPQRGSTLDADKRAMLQAKADGLTLQLAELAKQKWKIQLSSMPATVPEGARVIPTGTQLTLHCQKGDQQLISMNFADQSGFVWQPGECSGVTLSVLFPDFTVRYQLSGDDAWPAFIRRFPDGEALLSSDEFGDDTALLNQLGIKHLLVRFKVSDPQPIEDAWQRWHDLTEQIAGLTDQITTIDERIQQRATDSLSEPISGLPDDIAQCH